MSVKGASYLRLIQMSGGVWPLLLVQVVMICFIGCQILGDYYTQKWANAPAAEQKAHF